MSGPGSRLFHGFLPERTTGVEETGRTGVRILAAVALVLGYSATAACSSIDALPVAPSPGLNASRPPASPGLAQTTSGRGETKPGIQLIAVPHRDGSFDITENVLLPAATDILTLQPPSAGDHLPGMMSRTAPRVTNLKVVADDQAVPIENTALTAAADVPLTVSATKVRLTYRLTGSTVLASPSTQSTRAGAAIRPLVAGAEGSLPTDVAVTSGLLNAVCPLLTETRCAVGDPPTLKIQAGIPASKALVVLQLDLPR